MVQKLILWSSAILVAAASLVAGCINVDVPDGPYVVAGRASSSPPPSPKDRERVGAMSRADLENEVLRLTAENNRLRQEVAELKRKCSQLDAEKDRLEDRVEDLEDRLD